LKSMNDRFEIFTRLTVGSLRQAFKQFGVSLFFANLAERLYFDILLFDC